ncbi:MAG TPA: response regulator, partial [Ardenticatenaceae bacterium]|nr:response regulator [Ardenticatenaceae bacterium]
MSQGTPHRILIVDSNLGLAELLRLILLNEGYEVILAATAEEGYLQAAQRAPDLAITEVELPDMDGYTLVRRLRQNPATRSFPILMATARTAVADKIAGFEAGAEDYLTKPFQPKELLYRIRSLLARARDVSGDGAGQRRGKIVVVFSTKGGVGKTTIAVNLAVALHKRTRGRVALFDADFFFGDVDAHLNLPPDRNVLDLIGHLDELYRALADQVLVPHPSGIHVLLSPFRPEEAELITAEHVTRLLEFLAEIYEYIVVDCQAIYDNQMLVVLEHADALMVVVTPEVGPLRNASVFMELATKLGLPDSRVSIILNRSNSNVGLDNEEIERMLQNQVA